MTPLMRIGRFALFLPSTIQFLDGFEVRSSRFRSRSPLVRQSVFDRHICLNSSRGSTFSVRRNVEIPLLDLRDSEYAKKMVTPLPSSHLPHELRTVHLYGMQLQRPIHKMLIEQAIEAGENTRTKERIYGHLVTNRDSDELVGAIGCAADILINAKRSPVSSSSASSDDQVDDEGEEAPITVLCRGSFRFQVREVTKTFPYPVAIVDELLDEPPSHRASLSNSSHVEDDDDEVDQDDDDEDDEEEDEDYEDSYSSLDTPDLVPRIMIGLKALVDYKLSKGGSGISPLEQVILEDSGVDVEAQQNQAEEMAAVLAVFQSSLIDIAPMPVDRYYAIGMLAAELADFENGLREKLLCMTDGIARLRVVLETIDRKVTLNLAKKLAGEATDKANEVDKDLKVGEPELPAWTKSLKDGTRIEYFWNEEYGWCEGVVVGEPERIVDELLVTVRFVDGETHRLPFRADEKVRWRPPQA